MRKSILAIAIICVLSLMFLLIPSSVFAQNNNNSTNNSSDKDTQDDDSGEDTQDKSSGGVFVGFAMITIDEFGKVKLFNELYYDDIKETPGIPFYRYIFKKDSKTATPIQVKAYISDNTLTKYLLDYVINLDSDGVMILRAVFKYTLSGREIDFIEHYISGRLDRIEYYKDGKVYAVERFDESGTYGKGVSREEIKVIDPYGFYNTYTIDENGKIVKYSVFYPNDEVLLKETYTEGTIANFKSIYDAESRTRTVKTLDSKDRVVKEEFFDENFNLIFYREYEYDRSGNYSKISIIEKVKIIDEKFVQREVIQKVIFYFENGKLVKRERYLDGKLISTTRYDVSNTSEFYFDDDDEDGQS